MQFQTAIHTNPFAGLLLFFVTGILSGSFLRSDDRLVMIWVPFILIAVFLNILVIISSRPRYHTGIFSGSISVILMFIAGMLSYNIYRFNGDELKKFSEAEAMAFLQVYEPAIKTEKTVKSIVRLKPTNDFSGEPVKQQKILVYFERDSLSELLKPGDIITSRIKLSGIPEPMNPYEFNYKRFLGLKKIYNQTYIRSGTWHLKSKNVFSIKALSCKLQQSLVDKYREIQLSPSLCNLLSAITLGYKNELDAHTKQVFSKAGVMHVMALSGFNVAVIAVAFNYLLSFLNRFSRGKLVKMVIVILVIWSFALITGLSPSVTRASLMITLVLTGKELDRNMQIKNILYASAFILLTISPSLIYDVSFQLSFAAVLGILVFHPPLNSIIKVRSGITSKIWQLFTVSLAAQIATLPFTLFYFNQFPVYFWITNLYVVPLVSIIICAAGIFLLLSFIEPLMIFSGKILAFFVTLLYKSVAVIEIMPYSVIENIRINLVQVVLLILMVTFVGFFAYQRRVVYIILMLAAIIIFQASRVSSNLAIGKQQILIVGGARQTTLISLIEGRSGMLLTSSNSTTPVTEYALGNFWIHHNVKILKTEILSGNLQFKFAGSNYVVLCNDSIAEKVGCVDVLIVTGRLGPAADIVSKINPYLLVVDSSVPEYKVRQWITICKETGTTIWVVSKSGAYNSTTPIPCREMKGT